MVTEGNIPHPPFKPLSVRFFTYNTKDLVNTVVVCLTSNIENISFQNDILVNHNTGEKS